MTQQQMIDSIFHRIHAMNDESKVTKKDVKAFIEAFSEEIVNACKNGEKVNIPSLGIFRPHYVEARVNRNPRTGEPINSPAKTVLRFKRSAVKPL